MKKENNELKMANMTHEYNEAEAEKFRPEYERQLLEEKQCEIEQLKAENERLKEVLAVKESLELMLENQKLESQIKGLVGELERIYKTYGYQYTKEILTNYYNSIK